MNQDEFKNFYVSKDGVLYKLENNLSIVTIKQSKYAKHDYKYIGILSNLMSDRPDILRGIDKTPYTINGISKLIIAYNNGQVSYFWDPNIKSKANWIAITQYSNYGVWHRGKTKPDLLDCLLEFNII